MPVFLFAVSQLPEIDYRIISLTFIILHVLVYPASNIFNSYYDRDEGSVGGLRCPPPPNNKMLWLANILDASAILLSLSIHQSFSILVSSYILASRLYSYRPIRLKKYPIIGFFVIFIFQGAFTFYLTRYSLLHWHVNATNLYGLQVNTILPMLSSSFQIGAIYPLTQIYQHKSDLADGVTTLSYKLGYRGTFIFAGIMFGIATLFYFLYFSATDINDFYIFTVVQMPIIGYFVYWASKVWKDTQYADYKHTMYMNVIAAVILNLFFLYLVLT
jgi:1,4-dihydroxy-2-naphthoate octaprenyltransferase